MMASSSHATAAILQISIFLLIFPLTLCNFPSSQTLILPLKTQNLPHSSSTLQRLSSSSSSHKLSFTHNVTLTVSLAVGSPLQSVTMVLDTGSELPWLHCKKAPNLTSIFDPIKSSSYSAIPCSSPVCTTQTRDLPVPASCDPNSKLCHVAVSYADATAIEGNLANDTFVIGSSTRPGFAFGCMDSGSGSNSEEDAKTTGLMGMNRGSLSLVNQLGFSKFSYCISGVDSSGILLLGDASFSSPHGRLQYTRLVQQTTPLPNFDRFAFTVQLEGIRVGSKVLDLPKSAFVPDHTGAGQTLLDSGTQFTFLLGLVYAALKTEFLQQTKSFLPVLDDPNFVFQGAMDLCYRVGSTQPDYAKLPTVSLMFSGAEMSVSGQKLLYRVPGPASSGSGGEVYCFTFGNSDLLGIEAFVVGHHHQQNLWVEFDLAKSMVGFAEVRCDQASQRLRLKV